MAKETDTAKIQRLTIIQSEISQKEKNTYHILLYMESIKMVLMNLFAGLQWRCRFKEKNCGERGRRREWEERRE